MAADEINWEACEIDWDGHEGYTLVVPHCMVSWPSRWLEHKLPVRLRTVFPRDVGVVVTRGWWDANGIDRWGEITIGPFALPLQHADPLRQVVDKAADDVHDASERTAELHKAVRGLS